MRNLCLVLSFAALYVVHRYLAGAELQQEGVALARYYRYDTLLSHFLHFFWLWLGSVPNFNGADFSAYCNEIAANIVSPANLTDSLGRTLELHFALLFVLAMQSQSAIRKQR
jgi:hypothetical protein